MLEYRLFKKRISHLLKTLRGEGTRGRSTETLPVWAAPISNVNKPAEAPLFLVGSSQTDFTTHDHGTQRKF